MKLYRATSTPLSEELKWFNSKSWANKNCGVLGSGIYFSTVIDINKSEGSPKGRYIQEWSVSTDHLLDLTGNCAGTPYKDDSTVTELISKIDSGKSKVLQFSPFKNKYWFRDLKVNAERSDDPKTTYYRDLYKYILKHYHGVFYSSLRESTDCLVFIPHCYTDCVFNKVIDMAKDSVEIKQLQLINDAVELVKRLSDRDIDLSELALKYSPSCKRFSLHYNVYLKIVLERGTFTEKAVEEAYCKALARVLSNDKRLAERAVAGAPGVESWASRADRFLKEELGI